MDNNLILSTKETAEFFGTTSKTILEWKKAGCPQVKKGKWDLKQVFDWWKENIIADPGSDDESLAEARRRYWSAKAGNEELKQQQTRGDLISWDSVTSEWAKRVAEYKSGCFNLVNSLPPLLEGKTQAEMRSIIYDFVWNMFESVVRTGTFCPNVQEKKKGKSKKK